MAEGEEFFGGKMAIRVLVTEEHSDNRGDRKGIQDPGLLDRFKAQAGQVTIDKRQSTAPDEELQNHHEEEAEADGSIHRLLDAD